MEGDDRIKRVLHRFWKVHLMLLVLSQNIPFGVRECEGDAAGSSAATASGLERLFRATAQRPGGAQGALVRINTQASGIRRTG